MKYTVTAQIVIPGTKAQETTIEVSANSDAEASEAAKAVLKSRVPIHRVIKVEKK